jgi:hypothetical protein
VTVFVDYKLFFSLEVSNPNFCSLEAVANTVVPELTFCDFLQPGQTLCQDVTGTEDGEESAVCIYIVCAF